MKVTQVIRFFGTQTKAAKALEVSQPAISNWKRRGVIPVLQQFKIQALTKGALKADRSSLRSYFVIVK